jgi:hypothetical protein
VLVCVAVDAQPFEVLAHIAAALGAEHLMMQSRSGAELTSLTRFPHELEV